MALGINWLVGRPLLNSLEWFAADALKGLIAAVPPLAFFVWALTSTWSPMLRIRYFMDGTVRRMFQPWNVLQLFILSALAGIGEELLFRGAIQSNLIPHMGTTGAILVASILFGLCHFITPAYAVMTCVMGVYLGLLHLYTDNLLVPMVTHGIYDFVALIYFLRIHTSPLSPDKSN